MSTDDVETIRRRIDQRDVKSMHRRRRVVFRFALIGFIANLICGALLGWGVLSGHAPSNLGGAAIGITLCALIQVPFIIRMRRELAVAGAHSSEESKT